MLSSGIIPVMSSKTTIESALKTLADNKLIPGDDASIVPTNLPANFIDSLIQSALEKGASNIHIEPMQENARIRFRIDGQLSESIKLSSEAYTTLVARLKTRGDTDISVTRKHQSGQFEFTDPQTDDTITVSLSFFVTVLGVSVVLRLTTQNGTAPSLSRLGMESGVLRQFTRGALETPGGMVIITGPTDSGKTTTLYSCIQHIAKSDSSIVTVEDPVECRIAGVSHCAVGPKLGVGLEQSLEQIPNHDADVVVLGELRDHQSMHSAMHMAFSGKKVLTTHCAEDSIGSLLYLMSINHEAFQHSSVPIHLVSQRLLRRVCPDCATHTIQDAEELSAIGWNRDDTTVATFMSGAGCANCKQTGFDGRVAVFEVLRISEQIREAIAMRKTSAQIRRMVMDTPGYVTLMEAGLLAAATGKTTLQEVKRTFPHVGTIRGLQELSDCSSGSTISNCRNCPD